MTREKEPEEKRIIIREWDRWRADNIIPADRKANGADGVIFYNYLRKERPELFNFKTKGQDLWRIVHKWLTEQRKVIN